MHTPKSLRVLQLQAMLFEAYADEAREHADQAVFVAYYEAQAKARTAQHEKAKAEYEATIPTAEQRIINRVVMF